MADVRTLEAHPHRNVSDGTIVDMLVTMNPRIVRDMSVLQQFLRCWAGTYTDAVRPVVTEEVLLLWTRSHVDPSFVWSLVLACMG